LFPAIKASVDRDRSPGRFLLTGSANELLLPTVSESLAGRMEILTLWPLAQAEIEGSGSGLIYLLYGPRPDLPITLPTSRDEFLYRILASGYPEPQTRASAGRRRAWFASYLTSILQRDVRDLANIERLTDMPRLVAILASRIASQLNIADISRRTGIPHTTLVRYMSLFETIFLVQLLPAWSANIGVRLVRSPKLLFNDSGLAASFIGLDAERLQNDGSLLGHVLENFVIMEIIKAIGVSKIQPRPYHYRTNTGVEIDLVLEAPDGSLVAVEIKAFSTVTAKDFKGIRALADATNERFCRGILVYTGNDIVPFGENLFAMPIQALWSLT
jgi:uncharacterized protein